MKSLGHFIQEAKATYCGRCGTRHVPPAKGGTCPALKEGSMPTADEPTEHDKKMAQKVRDLLAKEKKPVKEERDNSIRIAKVLHKGQHIANVTTYRGRHGNWVSGAETPDGKDATKKYGIGLIDTKKEIMKKIKDYHKNVKEEAEQIDEISTKLALDYTDKASDARGHRNLSTAKLDKRYKSMALAHEKIRKRHAMVPTTEETKMKTLSQFLEEATLNEAHDVELKPHENGTHYVVHKIHPQSGIEKDQLKVGEKISDTHVDDLHDMGYSVKIHKK